MLCIILSLAHSERNLFVNVLAIYLGKISYSLYLSHVFVIVFLFPAIQARAVGLMRLPGDARYFIYLLLVVAATAAIGSVTYYLIELPLIKLGQRLASKISNRHARQHELAAMTFSTPG